MLKSGAYYLCGQPQIPNLEERSCVSRTANRTAVRIRPRIRRRIPSRSIPVRTAPKTASRTANKQKGRPSRPFCFASPWKGDALSEHEMRGGLHPEDTGGFLRIHRRCRFCGDTATVAPRAYFFLSCQKKVCKKEAQDAEIALTRRKTSRSVLRIFVTLQV